MWYLAAYHVGVHFSGTSNETALDKILRLVKNEAQNKGAKNPISSSLLPKGFLTDPEALLTHAEDAPHMWHIHEEKQNIYKTGVAEAPVLLYNEVATDEPVA